MPTIRMPAWSRVGWHITLLVLAAAPAAAESISLFAADCTTAQFIFTQGDTVCAKVTGVSLPNASRFQWQAADGSVAQDGPTITAEGQTSSFAIPGNLPQAKRGSWQVVALRNSDDTPLAGVSFAVIETVRIFAADCATPRTLFALGDTVCAIVSNLPSPVNIELQWIAPDFSILLPEPAITSDPQANTVVIPTTGSFAQTGSWDARTANVADASGRVSSFFTVVASIAPLTVSKTFSPSSIATGGTSLLTVVIANPNPFALHASFTDTYPPGLVNAGSPSATSSCAGGTVTAGAGGPSLAIAGGTVPAAGSCTVSVNVTSATGAVYANSLGAGSVTTEGPANAAAASAQLTVNAPAIAAVPTLSGAALALLSLLLLAVAAIALRRRL